MDDFVHIQKRGSGRGTEKRLATDRAGNATVETPSGPLKVPPRKVLEFAGSDTSVRMSANGSLHSASRIKLG